LQIREKDLKNLYEKFCFLNHYTPLSLADPAQIQKLGVYGFKIVDDEDKAQVFAKLSSKKEVEDPAPSDLNTNSTIDLFIKINYDVTTINTDTEWTEDFEEKYLAFCQEYRLPVEYVRIDDLAVKYNLDVLLRPRKKVVKNITPKVDDSKVVGVEQETTAQKVMKKMFSGLHKMR
jgi:hypothetical protein